MSDKQSERDEVRDKFAETPGVGHHIERELNTIANAKAYGADHSAADAVLENLDYETREQAAAKRADAAAKRKADASKSNDGDASKAQREAPKGRRTGSKQTTDE